MTAAQERAVKRIRKLAENCFYSDAWEIKEWEVNENEYFVSVIVEIGHKNDEGTLAAIICRDRAHLFIGKRGGITYPVTKTLKNGEHKTYYKRFGGYSLLQAVCDQRL